MALEQAVDSALQRVGLDPDQLYRVEEAAQKLCVSRALVYVMIKNGDLASLKVAGARRVPGWGILRIIRAGMEGDAA